VEEKASGYFGRDDRFLVGGWLGAKTRWKIRTLNNEGCGTQDKKTQEEEESRSLRYC